jgi:hypothetical protein
MIYVRQSLAALAAAWVVAACGGGDAEALPLALVSDASTSQATLPSHVRVEGCVRDLTDRPLALAVHATGTDGRLLASALTDNDGVFRMHVPAREVVRFATATPGAEPLLLMTGSTNLTVGGCLRPGFG